MHTPGVSHGKRRQAEAAGRRIYRDGFDLAKAGVMLMDLSPADRVQHELGLDVEARTAARDQRLMNTMDRLNGRFGKGTVQSGSVGPTRLAKGWSMRQERRTPNYTTNWEDLPIVRA